MRVLVTGAGGFVGANLVRHLQQTGHDVHAVVRPGASPWRLDGCGLSHVHAVACEDQDVVKDTLRSLKPDWVFHLAAYGGYPTQTDRSAMVASNVLGTMHLIDAALAVGFSRFVHVGTSSEYGSKDHPATEDSPLEPNSGYAVTKAAGTLYCRQAARRTGAPVVIARLYSVYGPWEEPTRLIPTLLVHALAGTWPPLVAPETPRDFVFVDDVVLALCRLAGDKVPTPGDILNVGSGRQRTVKDVVEEVARLLSVSTAPQWDTLPARSWDTSAWVGDVSKIARLYEWKAETSLDAGLAATLAWLTADPARLGRYQDQVHGHAHR